MIAFAKYSRPAGSEWTSGGHTTATSSFHNAAATLGAPLLTRSFNRMVSRFLNSTTGNAYHWHRRP